MGAGDEESSSPCEMTRRLSVTAPLPNYSVSSQQLVQGRNSLHQSSCKTDGGQTNAPETKPSRDLRRPPLLFRFTRDCGGLLAVPLSREPRRPVRSLPFPASGDKSRPRLLLAEVCVSRVALRLSSSSHWMVEKSEIKSPFPSSQ